ncbi:MAG: amidohydrolase family protein [Emergencia sp.]
MQVISNCNVIPMTEDAVLKGYDIFFEKGVITGICPHGKQDLSGLEVYDGTGKYAMPALMDSHVHVSTPEDFRWYLAYGVTRISCMMGTAKALTWRKELSEGKRRGPKMKVSSPIIDGTDKYLAPTMDYGRTEQYLPLEEEYGDLLKRDCIIEAKDEKNARKAVRYARAAGYDYVKLYNNLKREVYFAACDEAEKQGIMAVGHMMDCLNEDNFDGVIEPFRYGQKSIEHIASINETIMEQCLAEGVAIGTTFAVEKLKLERYEESDFYQAFMKDIPEGEKEEWRQCGLRRRAVYANEPDRKPVKRRGMEFYQKITKEFQDRGGLLLAGTDSGIDGLLPGVDMHIELQCLSECGLSNFEVLKTATVNPAGFYWKGEATGTLEAGAPAEILILEGNPLENISSTWDIDALVCGTEFYDRDSLSEMKKNRRFIIYNEE